MPDIFKELVQLNFIPLSMLIFLYVALYVNGIYEKDVSRWFYPVTGGAFLLLVCDNLDYHLVDVHDGSMWHVGVNVVGYNLRVMILLFLLQTAMRNKDIYRTNFFRNWRRIVLFVPALIMTFVTLLAFFTKLVFWYDENGEFTRGPLAFTPHVVCFVYVVIIISYCGFITRKQHRGREAFVLILFTMFALITTIIESFSWCRGLLATVIIVGTVFYYLCLHTEYFKYDILTGVFNRTNFKADLDKAKAKGGGAVMSIDLNGLKMINDIQGHLAGDTALKIMAKIIMECINDKCKAYRMGGDEFTIIAAGVKEDEVHAMIDKMRAKMEKTSYSFAIGYSMWAKEQSFEEAFAKADEEMYKNKAEMKGGADKIRR